jgi:hypothetical protein
MTAAKRIILCLWLVLLGVAQAPAAILHADENRTREKIAASSQTRLAESSQVAGSHQENAPPGWGTVSGCCLAAEGRLTTVIGSMNDVGRHKNMGYNILERPAGMTNAEFGRHNAEWMNAALRRGDTIMAVTDPPAHQWRLESLGRTPTPQSNYLNIELPILEHFGATVPWKESIPPVVPFYFIR